MASPPRGELVRSTISGLNAALPLIHDGDESGGEDGATFHDAEEEIGPSDDLFGQTFGMNDQPDSVDEPSTPSAMDTEVENDPPAPSSPPIPTPSAPLGPLPIDVEKDLSRNQRNLRKFHARAVQVVPRIHLPAHRYWVGVYNVNEKPHTTLKETSFTWMRGNRLTTVETVWHVYAQTCVEDGFTLVVAGCVEIPDMDVRMEEIDYLNDKKVFFRAIKNEDVKKEIGELGVFWGAVEGEGKMMAKAGEKKVVSEVIVIDDD
jgi:hypothetical protein